MKISIWWILPVFYAGLFLGICIVAMCRAAKAGDAQPKPEKPAPEQKTQADQIEEIKKWVIMLRREALAGRSKPLAIPKPDRLFPGPEGRC